jgi:TolA-binding protein
VRALSSLGRYYFRLREWERAVQRFLEILDRYPDHPLTVDAYLGLGEAFYHRKDYPRALSYLEELAGREDVRCLDRVYLIQGRIYYEQDEFELAIDRLSFVLERFPESSLAQESQYWVACSYYRMGKYERAIEAFVAVTEHPPSSTRSAEAFFRIGECNRHLDSYEAAQKAYTRVIREYPHSRIVPKAEHGILLTLESQGDYERFDERANAFLIRYPTHPLGADILMRIARRYLDEDRVDKAIHMHRALIWRYPRNELTDDAQFRLGEIYRDQQDFERAISAFGLVVKQYPRSGYLVDAYYEIAQSYFALGDYRRALEGYERVTRGFPESHRAEEAAVGEIDCLRRLDRIDLAEARLLELRERGLETPLRSQPSLRRGLILSRAMRYGEAIEVLREVTRLAGAEEASLAQLKIGEIYREMDDSRRAINELMKTVSLYPGQTDRVDAALFEVGEIYMEQRRWVKAKRIYARVIEISSSESARKKAQEILAEIESEYVNQ